MTLEAQPGVRIPYDEAEDLLEETYDGEELENNLRKLDSSSEDGLVTYAAREDGYVVGQLEDQTVEVDAEPDEVLDR